MGSLRARFTTLTSNWRICSCLLLLVLLLAPSLLAQNTFIPSDGVSQRYALERERQRRQQTEAVQVGFDVGGALALFNHNFRSTDGGGPDLHWSGDALDEEPLGLMLDGRLNVRTSWEDGFSLEYQWFNLTSFTPGADFDVKFGNATIPAGSDLDVRSTMHHFVFQYRRDFESLDIFDSQRLYGLFGFAYDNVRFSINSDAFPLENDSERMREMLPYPVMGIGYEEFVSREYTLRGYVRAGWLPRIPTLQKRRGDDVTMQVQYYEIGFENDWQPNPWVAIGAYARLQYFQHELRGGGVAQLYKMTGLSIGLRVGIRL